MEKACNFMARFHLDERGSFLPTRFGSKGTTGSKAAAGRWVDQIGH